MARMKYLYQISLNEAPRSKAAGYQSGIPPKPTPLRSALQNYGGVPLAPSSSKQASRYSAKGNKLLSPWKIFLLGFTWITLNVYFLPFSVWTAGITRPWYVMHGYIPYKDFVWIRMPLDLFILSGM